MNRFHRWFCRTSFWKKALSDEIIPWALKDVGLGDDVLEVGPGPGMTTDILRERLPRLTSIEIDPRLAGYVKAIFQAGGERSDSYKTPRGYPVEIILRQNPYAIKAGQTLEVLCLKDGQPFVNQFVSAGRELNGREVTLPSVRCDNNGIARITLKGAGKWYVKFIQMAKVDDPQLNYESKWATLTFEVK